MEKNNLPKIEENPLWDAEKYFGGNQNAGRMVQTKNGLIGRTFNNEEPINGKIRVYTEKGKLLCSPETLILKGFID